MLGKLYKHELKGTAMQVLPLSLLVIVLSVINRFVMMNLLDMGTGEITNTIYSIFMVIYVIFITCFVVIIFAGLASRFNKTMTADQGYLTLTLPASSWQHLLVKSTVATFWLIVSTIVTVFAFLLFIPEKEIFSNFINGFGEMWQTIAISLGISTGLVITEVIIGTIIGILTLLLIVYLATAIGQLWTPHRKLGGILAFVGIYSVYNLLSNLVFDIYAKTKGFANLNSMLSGSWGNGHRMNGVFLMPREFNTLIIIAIIFSVVFCVISFLAASYLFEKKPNLQ